MKWIVFILFFITLLADIYIYRSVICACFRRLPARIAYIIYAVITDGAAVVAFSIYSLAAAKGPGAVIAVMWIVWVFLFTALPKLLFLAGGFIDYLISLISRRHILVFRPVAVALAITGMVMMVYGATKGRTRLKVNEVEICSELLPEGFDGYRIVQFSDLHIGTIPNAVKRISQITEKINGLSPDIVVNTGDLVNISYADLPPEIMSELSKIKATDGVWSVWGNHDLGFYIKDTVALTPYENLSELSDKLRDMGWNDLTNRSVYLSRRNDTILLSGVNYPEDQHLNNHNSTLGGVDIDKVFAGKDKSRYSIVLSHAPQLWRKITDVGFGDLTLSGHVHSMQIKFSLFGKPWSPAKYIHPEWSGLYTENKEKKYSLYVNDGIGCVGYPMRIGAAPELTLFILKRCE